MKRISGMVVMVLALAGLALGVAGASGASRTKQCAASFTESRSAAQLTVSGDTCANARHVADKAGAVAPLGCIKLVDKKTGRLGFRKPCAQAGYRCTAVGVRKSLTLHVTCTRPGRVVRFTY
ncbi:MAG: hypothetical protein JWQ18_1297 [Conexibacter sp.]|nr:hypothetical protein [Conexibacter sp.]